MARTHKTENRSYVALGLFHYPDGVATVGQTVVLPPDVAERALAQGLVRLAEPQSSADPKNEE